MQGNLPILQADNCMEVEKVAGKMVKTPDEIKKALQGCHSFEKCSLCPYYSLSAILGCKRQRNADALAYIQQLERERDAICTDLKTAVVACDICKHEFVNASGSPCRNCRLLQGTGSSNFEWRGVKEE